MGVSRLLVFVAPLAVGACQAQPIVAPEPMETVLEQQGTASAKCPDDRSIDLDYCEFEGVQAAISAKGTASTRLGNAMSECRQFNQTTINFCLKFLFPLAERELITAFARANPSPSVATYVNWKKQTEADCTPNYPREEGGTGYSSRITFCEIEKFAGKIDELSLTRKSGSK